MGLFSFLKSEPVKDEPVIKSLNDIFSFKFNEVPNDTFISSKHLNSEGLEVITYRKILTKKECGIFDTIEVKLIPTNTKNIILSTTDINSININDVRKLVDSVFLCLGVDDDSMGRFNSDDKERFGRGVFWSRMWIMGERKTPIMLGLNSPIFDMSIHSVELLTD